MSSFISTEHEDILDIAPESSPILDALEAYTQFIDELFDHPRPHAAAWEGNVQKVAVRSVGRLISKWRHSASEDQPPHSLIVRLSRKLADIVTDIAEQPRKILERQRSMEPVNRFRELDANCVRWLIRRPGITLAEKAGSRQQILAVQRFESVNTLENRVLIDLLERCQKLALEYLRLWRERFPNHPWIQMTQRFKEICTRYVASARLISVKPLSSFPQPNYVLLHEPRYHEIWQAYEQVYRQQQRRQMLWQNRTSAWSEMCTIALWSLLSRLARKNGRQHRETHRCDLWITDSLKNGGFIDWTSCPCDWLVWPNRQIAVLPVGVANRRYAAGFTGDFVIARMVGRSGVAEKVFDIKVQLNSKVNSSEQDEVRLVLGKSGNVLKAPVNLIANHNFFDSWIVGLLVDD